MRVIVFITAVLFSSGVFSQNFVGMHKDEINRVMAEKQPNFKLDKNAINRTYNYLKFVDKISEQTILFFLAEDERCTYIRWMSDYANLNDILSDLDKKYRKKDEKTWYYTDKGQEYIVKMEEGEWFFTISIRKK